MMEIPNSEVDTGANVYLKDNKTYKVSDEFLTLIGYRSDDILGKPILKILEILKANTDTYIMNGKLLYEGYIFTNEDKPKRVTVTCEDIDYNNKKICFVKEESDGFLRGLLSTCVDNPLDKKESSAIYSYPDMVHLKVSGNYKERSESYNKKTLDLTGKTISFPNHILKNLKETGYYYSEEEKFVNSEGITSYWTLKGTVIYGDNGLKFLKITFVEDTDKVLIRKDLEEQTLEMETILNNIPVAVTKLDKQGNYTYTNDANLAKLSHYRSGDDPLNNREIHNYFKLYNIHGKELSFEEMPAARVLNGEKLIDYIIVGTSDLPTTYHKCNGIPLYDEQGNVQSALLMYEDIESKYKIEEYNALARNMKNLNINYAVISANDFKIQYLNENAFESVQMSDPHVKHLVEVIGENFFNYYASNTDERESLMANMRLYIEGKPGSYTYTQKFLEKGQIEYIKTIFQPILDENNQLKQISCVGMNITHEELENQRMARSLQAQEEIFINTSHELKTPLNLIFSASQLLNLFSNEDSTQVNKVSILKTNKIIADNCYRLTKLINNILDTSKIESGFYELKLSNYNIVENIDDIVQSVSVHVKSKGIKLIFDTEVEELIIALDIYKFDRILLNLISNAMKFSTTGGLILIKLVENNNTIRISVTDEGIGIEQEKLDIIFNKFIQLNKNLNRTAEGTGLGLPLAKAMAEIHGGSLSVESTLGKGSTFTIELPMKTVDNIKLNQEYDNNIDRVETIRHELSDIY